MAKQPRVLTIVLAGGAGSRLGALTAQRAKPALPFAGSYNLIDFVLSNCVHSGLSDVWVVEQYEAHSLNEHLANGRPWDLDRTYGGLRVLPPFERRGDETGEGGFAGGNADALYRNRALLREFRPDHILVLSADHVYKLDYRDVITHHLATGAEVTAVTTEIPREQAARHGVVQVNQGRITAFAYKPEQPETGIVTTEVFLYRADRLLHTLEEIAADVDEEGLQDFGHHLLPRLVDRGQAHEFRMQGYWRDVGTVDAYWQAHQDLLSDQPGLQLDDPDWPILTYAPQRLPARVTRSGRVDESLLAPGACVSGLVERSVLGPGVVVEQGAVVRNSVLLDGVRVARGCTVDRAIVNNGVHVRQNVTSAEIAVVGE